jgi:putative addiction module killer protein
VIIELRKTARFARWLDELRDLQGRARIQARLERLAAGNPGDVAPVGEGVSELRVDVGPGYRVYFTRRGRTVIVLLAGGSKHTQPADIKAALQLARGLSRRRTSRASRDRDELELTVSRLCEEIN